MLKRLTYLIVSITLLFFAGILQAETPEGSASNATPLALDSAENPPTLSGGILSLLLNSKSELRVTVVTRMTAKSDMVDTVKQKMMSLVTATRQEPGAVLYDPFQQLNEDTYFILHELWRDWNAIGAHMATDHFNDFMTAAPELFEKVEGTEEFFEVMVCTSLSATDTLPSPCTIVTIETALAGKEALAKAALELIASQSIKEAGNTRYDIYGQLDDPSAFLQDTIWSSPSALEAHINTQHYKDLVTNAFNLFEPTATPNNPFEVFVCNPFVPPSSSKVRRYYNKR